MTRSITSDQRQQVSALRTDKVSLRQIAKRLAIPLGTVKTLCYSGREPLPPPVRNKTGQFVTAPVRTGPGRKPKNGFEAQSDAERAAAYRVRKKAALLFRDEVSQNVTKH